MNVTYVSVENAIIQKLITTYPNELSSTRVVVGDIDSLFQAIFEENESYGVFLEFGGGRRRDRETFKGNIFIWSLPGIFLIRYGDDIETKLRAIVDRLATLFDDDHTVGGVTPLAQMQVIGEAEVAQVNDVPFYWIPFMIEAFAK